MTEPATILIVDDESANRRLLQALLGPEGYVTRTADSGQEALASIADDPPDLILLDVLMPGLDGRQVASALKADPATANIPIIAPSALAMKADKERSQTAGCDSYIVKPLRYQELYAVMEHLLQEPQPDATQAPPPGPIPT